LPVLGKRKHFSNLQYLIQAVNTRLVHCTYNVSSRENEASCSWKQMFAVGSTTENEEVI